MEAIKEAPLPSTLSMGAFITMLYEPAATFRRLQAKPRGWLPMLALMATSGALTVWYFSVVDFPWLMDQMFAALKSAAERERAAAVVSKNFLLVSSSISTVVVFPLFFAIMGGYLLVVSKALSHGLTFGKCFALAAWANVPTMLLLPLGAMQILLASSGQLALSELNPVSLNQLLFHYGMANPYATLLDTVSVTSVWSAVLLVIGFETWAQVKRVTAILVVLIPMLLIYGAWLAFAVSRAA